MLYAIRVNGAVTEIEDIKITKSNTISIKTFGHFFEYAKSPSGGYVIITINGVPRSEWGNIYNLIAILDTSCR